MRRVRIGPFAAVLAAVALVGCGGGPKMAEVEGTLTRNGQPLDKIQVEFWPEGPGPRSIGETDAQGRFTLASDDGKHKGAAVGSHKIILRDVGVLGDKFLGRAAEDVDMTKGKKARIGEPYNDANKTTLKKDVAAGKNQIDIQIP